MMELVEKIDQASNIATTVTLPFESRQKARLRATLDNGVEAAMKLPRGLVLRSGDLLKSTTGHVVKVVAATESVSIGSTDDALLHARACYHLGNRHVPLQINKSEIIYLHDHVLDDLLRSLGLRVRFEQRPFEPETGAYHRDHLHAHT